MCFIKLLLGYFLGVVLNQHCVDLFVNIVFFGVSLIFFYF